MNTARRFVSDLASIVGSFPDQHVWVAGDLMLDEYVHGEVERISPEAPVPVVHVRESQNRLGGATNVARQIAALGARVSLCGVIGKDAAGKVLLDRCEEKGIDTRGVACLDQGQTTRKLRVLGHGQQLLRLDWEETSPCPPEVVETLVDRLVQGQPPDVVVLSDYAKGFLTPGTNARLLTAARDHRVPALVDPKGRDYTAYHGASIITPNLRELEAVTGQDLGSEEIDTIAEAARSIVIQAELEAMVVTLGGRGMLAVPRDGPHVAVSAHRRAVYDVTGAGDTAIAVLALSLAAGASLSDATYLANTAAGIAVGEVGAVSVLAEDILAVLSRQHTSKVLSRSELAAQVEAWHLQGRRVVFTNGCFDLLHIGHLSLLREAALLGDLLVLAINSDESVRRLKGDDRPLMPQEERAAILAALDCVDAVTIFDEDTPLETLQEVRPDVLVKGQDYLPHEVVGRELVQSYGGRLELVPLLPEQSTSKLVDRIRKTQKA